MFWCVVSHHVRGEGLNKPGAVIITNQTNDRRSETLVSGSHRITLSSAWLNCHR